MSKETAETLRRAFLLVDTPEKWCQGANERGAGARCADFAIRAVSPLSGGMRLDASRIFGRAINQIDIPSWNDKPERTHAEVVAAFRRAIALAEAEE